MARATQIRDNRRNLPTARLDELSLLKSALAAKGGRRVGPTAVLHGYLAGLTPRSPGSLKDGLVLLSRLSSGPRGIRTLGLLNAIETRSQLRYGPKNVA